MEGGGEVVEDGDPPGIAGCSGQLGLAQGAQPAGKMGGGRKAKGVVQESQV